MSVEDPDIMICFIVLNYNGFVETDKLLQSFRKWDLDKFPFRVIVVDNASTDDSFSRLKKIYSNTEYIDVINSQYNGGYSYGNNYGARYAINKYRPGYLAIVNPDVEFDQETVSELLKTFLVNNRIALCAPVMKSTGGKYSIYAQKLPRYVDDLYACAIRNKPKSIIKEGYSTLDKNGTYILTDMLPGSFFLVRTDYFSKVGMFDEHVFLYCEERILGKKIKDAGLKAILRADLFYVHAHSVTISRTYSILDRWKQIFQSRLYYQKEYLKVDMIRLMLLKIAMKWYLIKLKILVVGKRNCFDEVKDESS